jgi:hypothetical protein
MPFTDEVTGFSDHLGYVRCSEHAAEDRRQHPIYATQIPAYPCDTPNCGRTIGGEAHSTTPKVQYAAGSKALIVRTWK